MGIVRQILVGLVSVAFLLGGVTMVAPFGSEAEAGGTPKSTKKSTPKSTTNPNGIVKTIWHGIMTTSRARSTCSKTPRK